MNIPVTEWFPAEVKPVHVGVYECLNYSHSNPSFYYWNGKCWEFGGQSHHVLVIRDKRESQVQDKKWRGLTSPHPEWKP